MEPNGTADEEKFKELMLYVASKSFDDPTFGAVKLNKILCRSDFLTYAITGVPLTGVEYRKLPHGPAPRKLLPLQAELVQAGDARLVSSNLYNYEQKRLVPLREPNLQRFSGQEIAIVDSVLDRLRGLNATEVSLESHRWFTGWEAARDGETIPYETVFWESPELTPDLIDEGTAIAAQLGLLK